MHDQAYDMIQLDWREFHFWTQQKRKVNKTDY